MYLQVKNNNMNVKHFMMQIPNNKFQIPNKFKIINSKLYSEYLVWNLEFRIYLLFGALNL